MSKKTSLFPSLYLITEKNLQHEGRIYQTFFVLLFLLFQSSVSSLVLASKLTVSSWGFFVAQISAYSKIR